MLISVLIRLFLVFSTDGTYDVEIWETHAAQVSEIGLIEYYKISQHEAITRFNHPPFAAFFSVFLLNLSRNRGIPFKILFRLPFAITDFIAALYLFKIFSGHRNKYFYTAFYLLNPITFIMSSYHGNVDSILALLLVMSVYYVAQKQYLTAGFLLGFGANFKWIIAITCPALFFVIPDMKQKIRFTASFLCVFILGYVWAVIQVPGVVIKSIFGYRGLMIKTASGFIWGPRIVYDKLTDFCTRFFRFPTAEQLKLCLNYYLTHNSEFIVVGVVVYSWLRRRQQSVMEIGKTIGVVFCIFYALTNRWAFQYLSWSVPFWIFMGIPAALILTFFLSGYIYLLYSFVCQSPVLLGRWDLAGHPYLSAPILFFRDFSIIVCIGLSAFFFIKSISDLRSINKQDAECYAKKAKETYN